MRVRHRLRHLQQQPQPAGDRHRTGRAPGVDRLAPHKLQRQVRPPLVVGAGLVQAGDVRVLQRGQDVALACHALGQRVVPVHAGQLEGDLALVRAVSAFGQPDRTHAAAPQRRQQLPGPCSLAGSGVVRWRRGSVQRRQGVQEVVGLGLCVAAQQARQRGLKFGPALTQAIQPACAVARRQRQRFVEQSLDFRPAVGDVFHGVRGVRGSTAAVGLQVRTPFLTP